MASSERKTRYSPPTSPVLLVFLSEAQISSRHIYRKAASGDSNVVLRNILLRIKNSGKLDLLLGYIRDIYPGMNLTVDFDEERDYVIKVLVTFFGPENTTKPLELSGAGFIHARTSSVFLSGSV